MTAFDGSISNRSVSTDYSISKKKGKEQTEKIFQATDPSYSRVKEIAYNIFSTIILPWGITRLAWHGIHKLIGRNITKAKRSKNAVKDKSNFKLDGKKTVCFERADKEQFRPMKFRTVDGVLLEGMHITPKNYNKGMPTAIIFNGRGTTYQDQSTLINNYIKKGIAVFVFDYRSIGNSEGSISCQGTKRDGEAAVQYINKECGVDEKNIILHGHSLGGGIATEVAAKHPKVLLINDRSFVSLKEEIPALYKRKYQWLKKPVLRSFANLLGHIVHFFGWNYNAEKQFRGNSARKIIVYNNADTVIPEEVRLVRLAAEKNNPFDQARTLEMTENEVFYKNHLQLKDKHKGPASHSRPLSEAEFNELYGIISTILSRVLVNK